MNFITVNFPNFLGDLSLEAQSKVTSIATLTKYDADQIVYYRGETAPSIGIVKSGQVKVGTFGTDGDFTLLATLGPGQWLGAQMVFAGLPRMQDCIAVKPSEIYCIEGQKFMNLFDSEPEIARSMMKTSLFRLHASTEFIEDIRRLPLEVRVAKLILIFIDSGHKTIDQTPEGQITIDCSQIELASPLGVSRVALGKALKQLTERDLIGLGYSRVTVPNVQNLLNWVVKNSDIEYVKN